MERVLGSNHPSATPNPLRPAPGSRARTGLLVQPAQGGDQQSSGNLS